MQSNQFAVFNFRGNEWLEVASPEGRTLACSMRTSQSTLRLAIQIAVVALMPAMAQAQTCEQMTRSYEEANSAPVRNKQLLERLRRDAVRACGDGEVKPQPLADPAESQRQGQLRRNSPGSARIAPRKE